jgi:hypothetical protein
MIFRFLFVSLTEKPRKINEGKIRNVVCHVRTKTKARNPKNSPHARPPCGVAKAHREHRETTAGNEIAGVGARHRDTRKTTKLEYRNPNLETNSKYKCSNFQNRNMVKSFLCVLRELCVRHRFCFLAPLYSKKLSSRPLPRTAARSLEPQSYQGKEEIRIW